MRACGPVQGTVTLTVSPPVDFADGYSVKGTDMHRSGMHGPGRRRCEGQRVVLGSPGPSVRSNLQGLENQYASAVIFSVS